jgi:GT2 family glycosyltransferase
MPKLVEYVNPHPHTIQIVGPAKEVIKVKKFAKVILSDYFIDRYTPKFLRVVRILDDSTKMSVPSANAPRKEIKLMSDRRAKKATKRSAKVVTARFEGVRSGRSDAASRSSRYRDRRRRLIVGKAIGHASELYNQAVQEVSVAISNNIGVGILSYNRLNSLQRLVGSIRKYTDLSRTTVFISDESDDHRVKEWLSHQHDMVVMHSQGRLGISGNTNRLMNCLKRFRYKIILNDDVEILARGWENFYAESISKTAFHHFCYRQEGLYGATPREGKTRNVNGCVVHTIDNKPHGAVIAFDDAAFNKIGYFDESLSQYGMEHVDWSNRVSISGIQAPGFHDVIGSERFFHIHREQSVVPNRGALLRENRAKYTRLAGDESRIYVNSTSKASVPSIDVIIPIRDIGRSACIRTVINSIRAQRFPSINIIITEQDQNQKFKPDDMRPLEYLFVPNEVPNADFNKSRAFNQAVVKLSKNDNIILHDADIVVQADYIKKVVDILRDYEGCHIGDRVLYLDNPSTTQMCQTGHLDRSYKCERAVGYFEGGSIAFRKPVYFRIGGFNEAYEGYGCEDCDFFTRLKKHTKFYNQRSIDMFHLWHGRVAGWSQRHVANKRLAANIEKNMKDSTYISHLVGQLKSRYNV